MGYIFGITCHEAGEGRDAHQAVFKQGKSGKCAGDAAKHVEYVMVGGIYGGEPYSGGDYRKNGYPHGRRARAYCINQRHERIG